MRLNFALSGFNLQFVPENMDSENNHGRARKIASPTSLGYCVFQSGYQNVSLPCPTGYLKYRAPAGPYELFNINSSI